MRGDNDEGMNPGLAGEAEAGGVPARVCRLLAGMDVGLSAALAVLTWLLVHSWLRGEYWWAKLNVAGALFYGPEVYRMGVGRATLAGFALLVVVYSLLGLLYAMVAKTEGYGRNLLTALVWCAVWHLVAERWFWPGMDVFGPAYFPTLATLPAHLITALCLARFGVRYASLAASFGAPAPAAEPLPEPEREGGEDTGAGAGGAEDGRPIVD